ncbi:hypothetical protein LTR02_017252 [Friedmanniomyces endolithicus]|nr:hypothetical protein LTR02_017252 [Friedmanniomyces endolithicus]
MVNVRGKSVEWSNAGASTALSSNREVRYRRAVSGEEVKKAMRKVLGCEEQREALQAVVCGEQRSPLVVVLPTGGGKSLLFMAPACLVDPGVTIVVVPYRALMNNLVTTARKARFDCIEYRPGEQIPAALVFVSAAFIAESQVLREYACAFAPPPLDCITSGGGGVDRFVGRRTTKLL